MLPANTFASYQVLQSNNMSTPASIDLGAASIPSMHEVAPRISQHNGKCARAQPWKAHWLPVETTEAEKVYGFAKGEMVTIGN
jgi:hypothetical protein